MPPPQTSLFNMSSVSRLTTLVASIIVALSSGTNYVFSAYSPQLGSRLKINHTQLNVIGLAGNVGVYSSGPFWGRFIDLRGPRTPFLCAFLLLLTGYYGIRHIYDQGLSRGQVSVPNTTFILLVLFGFASGSGGNAGITSAINSTAKSFPDSSRATTVGLVLSGFGLSAFLFSFISRTFFPGDTSSFLLILAVGTACPMIMGHFLVRPIPIPRSTNTPEDQVIRVPDTATSGGATSPLLDHDHLARATEYDDLDMESQPSTTPGDVTPATQMMSRRRALLAGDVALTNVTGKKLARSTDFWLLFSILSLLAGTGLMYINNVGSISHALYAVKTPVFDDIQASRWQTAQVSTISVMSWAGRIAIGMTCDYAKNKLGIPRSYFLVFISSLFVLSQIIAACIDTVETLWIASSLIGFAYGNTYSLLATMCLDWFGLPHFSENWGYLSLAPILAANILSVMFGRNLDAHETHPPAPAFHSSPPPTGVTILAPPRCMLGRECYVDTFYVTIGACCLAILLSIWACWKDQKKLRMAAEVNSSMASVAYG